MNLDLGNLPRTIWVEKSEGGPVVGFVDQRLLPDDLALVRTADWREVVDAVKTLAVRGAPAIGVAGAAAVMLAAFECAADESAANLVRQGDPEAGIEPGTSFEALPEDWICPECGVSKSEMISAVTRG